ncbi:MAG: ABC transporter substrate-binding protein [Betaproteobacteria bacterium]
MKSARRRALTAGMLGAAALPSLARAQGRPIRIGGTLTLTGPLASLGIIHKVAGEAAVDEINQRGGLLGRPVEWVL